MLEKLTRAARLAGAIGGVALVGAINASELPYTQATYANPPAHQLTLAAAPKPDLRLAQGSGLIDSLFPPKPPQNGIQEFVRGTPEYYQAMEEFPRPGIEDVIKKGTFYQVSFSVSRNLIDGSEIAILVSVPIHYVIYGLMGPDGSVRHNAAEFYRFQLEGHELRPSENPFRRAHIRSDNTTVVMFTYAQNPKNPGATPEKVTIDTTGNFAEFLNKLFLDENKQEPKEGLINL